MSKREGFTEPTAKPVRTPLPTAEGESFGPYPATCKRVVDGDTFIANIDLGFTAHVEVSIRLHGVNAPEHNHPEGVAAKEYLTDLLLDAKLLISAVGRDMSFARYVCDVTLVGKGNLAEAIIKAGHGVPFDPKFDKWTR